MLLNTLTKVKRNFSGNRAFAHVAEIAQHHRIQASPGFREAALYCQKALQTSNLESAIIAFPADGKTEYWTQQMMEEWHCSAAWLDLILPTEERLACFADNAFSLIQRSISTAPEGVVADVVLLDKGDNPEPYADIDLTGTIVFTDGDLNKVRDWAVEKKGAIGIISDHMTEVALIRHRYDIPDALRYTSFWWTGHEKKCFGFVLSPKAGDKLRQVCRRLQEEHALDSSKPAHPQVRALVQASLYSGSIEDVTAVIPGETEEEIVITAHLCHPKASANDNASGSGVAIETARALQALISSGELPKPRRSIRILLVPEMAGTYAYLATNEDRIPKILAGINLDMVGENQDLCKGPLIAEYPPEAAGSFVGDLLASIMEEVAKESKSLGGTSSYALFKHTVAPFSGGSDHNILCDPTVGIPSPMLIQWPDKYYHTSEDTIDKVDPAMLYRVGCMTATYVYLLANLALPEAKWLLAESRGYYLQRITQLLKDSARQCKVSANCCKQDVLATYDRVQYKLERKKEELASLNRFLNQDEQSQFAPLLAQELAFLEKTTASLWQHHLQEIGLDSLPERPLLATDADYNRIPRRLFRGPVSMRGKLEKLTPDEVQAYNNFTKEHAEAADCAPDYLVYWADGNRTVAEIDHQVNMEIGLSDKAFALGYFRLLEKLGLIAWD